MKAFSTFLKTELKLSFRGIDMFIFAICLPVVILVLIGIINGNNPAFEGADYTFLDQSFGAISTIAICAGGLMGFPLVLSGYREKNIKAIKSYTSKSSYAFSSSINYLYDIFCNIFSFDIYCSKSVLEF